MLSFSLIISFILFLIFLLFKSDLFNGVLDENRKLMLNHLFGYSRYNHILPLSFMGSILKAFRRFY